MRRLKTWQIKSENRFLHGDKTRQFNLIVDATECPIERPSDYETQREYYSGKKKKHTVKYELGIQIETGLICWLAGGVPGRVHDLQVSRQFGLFDMLLPGELLLADKGYIGEDLFLTPMRQPEDEAEWDTNRDLSSVRDLVENVIGRVKVFQCTQQKWRHEIDLHLVMFEVVCNLANLEMMLHPMRS